jgi:hypothetical protein
MRRLCSNPALQSSLARMASDQLPGNHSRRNGHPTIADADEIAERAHLCPDRSPRIGSTWRSCKNSKCSATQDNQHRPSGTYPVVSVTAFLELAEWYGSFVERIQGGSACTDRKRESGERIADLADAARGIVSERVVDGSEGRGSSASLDGPQSDHREAASITSQHTGGVA